VHYNQQREAARQKTLAMGFLRGADPTKYGSLLVHLANQFASGRDEYPKDLTAAYGLLVHYKTPVNAKRPQDSGPNNYAQGAATTGNNGGQQQRNTSNPPTDASATANSAMTFAQGGGNAAPVSSITVSSPSTTPATGTVTNGASLVQYAVMMAQTAQQIDPWSILLDSQSTISVFNNKDMLTNVRSTPHVVRAITNGGFQDSNMIGEFPNLGDVYYNPDSIANISPLPTSASGPASQWTHPTLRHSTFINRTAPSCLSWSILLVYTYTHITILTNVLLLIRSF